MVMKTDDFDFYLPEKLIAQTPLEKRDSSKLLIMNRSTGEVQHNHFHNITQFLRKGDVLVLNDTKVMPARLYGVKEDTLAAIEILMLKELQSDHWECLVKPAKRVKVGTVLVFGDQDLKAICTEVREEGIRVFEFIYDGIFYEILDRLGEMPLPPYIHEKLKDQGRYQTVYAKNIGSAAAPTAGLHFTPSLLEEIRKIGVQVVFITLHVGLGTFRPVSVDDVTAHKMHSEFYMMSDEVASVLNQAKNEHRRIIGVGTTSVRTLESIMQLYGKFQACSGWTDIFIYPGYTFLAIDGMITNFHLPKSTLVMLVSAFSSRDYILHAYQEAVNQEYRFFSFGDSMFIQ